MEVLVWIIHALVFLFIISLFGFQGQYLLIKCRLVVGSEVFIKMRHRSSKVTMV